jgi:hypothetical protein
VPFYDGAACNALIGLGRFDVLKKLIIVAILSCGIAGVAHAQNLPGSTTNGSSTVTTGGTFQSALAASVSRKGCVVQNPTTATEPLYVYFGATGSATTATSISLAPGQSVSCNSGPLVLTDNVAVTATTSAHAFVVMSQ